MMDGMNNGMNNGWGMGYGYGWIIGLVALVFIIWLVVKLVNQNKKISILINFYFKKENFLTFKNRMKITSLKFSNMKSP
jgi:hypothetical protein